MIIKTLIMTDFQVFQGRHEFDLSPRTKYNSKKPIILFGGKNGAGKTTTLDAIKLVLYGRQSLGSNIALSKYHNHLINSIHRSQDSLVTKRNTNANRFRKKSDTCVRVCLLCVCVS